MEEYCFLLKSVSRLAFNKAVRAFMDTQIASWTLVKKVESLSVHKS